MPLIDLLRHGETVHGAELRWCGRTDVALSAAGWAQMWRAVEGRHWDRVVCSPLRRCSEFAHALALHLGIACRIDERWRELDFGRWENRSLDEIEADDADALRRFREDPSANPPPDGESLDSLRLRVQAARAALECAGGERVLVVTHGGPMRVLLAPHRPMAMHVAHAALLPL
ncbi:MAG: histidine phosphatase family protein [Gammaproteobacteria bacterium]